MDLGEEIGDAVVREVYEETGIEARFRAIINMRHQHGAAWGRDDLYVVCLMEPVASETIQHDEKEIAECAWLPLEEYVESTIVNAAERGIPDTMNSFFMKSIEDYVRRGIPDDEWGWQETTLKAKISTKQVTGLTNKPLYKMYHPPNYLPPRE